MGATYLVFDSFRSMVGYHSETVEDDVVSAPHLDENQREWKTDELFFRRHFRMLPVLHHKKKHLFAQWLLDHNVTLGFRLICRTVLVLIQPPN